MTILLKNNNCLTNKLKPIILSASSQLSSSHPPLSLVCSSSPVVSSPVASFLSLALVWSPSLVPQEPKWEQEQYLTDSRLPRQAPSSSKCFDSSYTSQLLFIPTTSADVCFAYESFGSFPKLPHPFLL